MVDPFARKQALSETIRFGGRGSSMAEVFTEGMATTALVIIIWASSSNKVVHQCQELR